jgi:hypothetical protein
LRQARYGHLFAIHILLLCAALAATLIALTQIKVSRETVRLELKAAGYVWKRAKLKGRDDDPQRARRLPRIHMLIENQRPDELILFADELDIDLLPRSAGEWTLKGAQLEVRAPGKNQKRYLAVEVEVVRDLLRSRSGSGGRRITHQNQV